MSAAASVTLEAQRQDGLLTVRISGPIDENFGEGDLARELQAGEPDLVIDLAEARRISSFGVRAWMRALARLGSTRIWFRGVRPSLVMQFNTVFGFAGNGTILSLFGPYVCTSCDAQPEILIDVMQEYGLLASQQAPSVNCPGCGAPLEFDELPADYFECVSSRPRPDPPSPVSGRIESSSGARRKALKINTDVADSLTAIWLSGYLTGRTRLEKVSSALSGLVLVVLEGIEAVDDEGAGQLGRFLATPGIQPVIARVPLDIFGPRPAAAAEQGKTMEALHRLVGSVPLCSVMVPVACAACGIVHVEVTRATSQAQELPCPTCRAALKLPLDQDVRRALAVSPEALTYLQAHAHGAPTGSPAPRAPSLLIAGRYEVLTRIATGGMAEVFLARQRGVEGFEKRVVLKRLLPHLARDAQFVQMFLQEARLAGRLSHPNVVQIFDLGKEGDDYYIAMELIDGWDLNFIWRELQARQLKIPVAVAVYCAAEIAAGLGAAHRTLDEQGNPSPVVHRDVSPHNVLVSAEGAVKLADFGLAKAMDSHGMTRTGQLKGKISYMAPEQVEGLTEPASDVFAAGLILYVLLTSTHPYQRASDVQSLYAVLTEAIPDVRIQRPDVSDALADIIHKATHRDVRARYQDGAELAAALNAYLGAEGTSALRQEFTLLLRQLPVPSVSDSTVSGTAVVTPTGVAFERTMIIADETSEQARASGDHTAVAIRNFG